MRKALPPICFFLAVEYLFQYGCIMLSGLALPVGALSPGWVNTFSCGACFLITIYSLSLYLQKRSETYLLWLFVLAAIAFVRTLSASVGLMEDSLHWLKLPLDIFTVVICYALCFWLTNSSLPGSWNFLLSPLGLMLLYGFLLLLRYTIPGTLLQIMLANMPYFAGLICLVLAAHDEKPLAYVLLFGMAARYGLRSYLSMVNQGTLPMETVFAYVTASQMDFLVFVVACLLVINHKFVSKFNESDRLVAELAKANANLDAKVAARTAELAQTNAKIVAEQKRKHSLMLNIFHDLRSPLFVLRGYTDMLETHNEGDAQRKLNMQERLEFLSRLIEDLFLIAKLEEGKVTFEHEALSLSRLCRGAYESARLAARAKDIAVELRVKSDGNILGDSFRLQQALQNLLENALHYTPAGGRIEIECAFDGDGGCIAVQDTGPGIPAAELPYLFDRYYHNARKGNPESTGLGLSIAQSIVQSHGGDIRVHSAQGEGSTFLICLPALD